MKALLLVLAIPLFVACSFAPSSSEVGLKATSICLNLNLPEKEYYQCKIRIAEELVKR